MSFFFLIFFIETLRNQLLLTIHCTFNIKFIIIFFNKHYINKLLEIAKFKGTLIHFNPIILNLIQYGHIIHLNCFVKCPKNDVVLLFL